MQSNRIGSRAWRRFIIGVSLGIGALAGAACQQSQEPAPPAERPAPTAQPAPAPGSAHLKEFLQEITSAAPVQTMKVNEIVLMPVTVKNISKETWPATGQNPVFLSYIWTTPLGKAVGPILQMQTSLPHDVAPGEAVELDAKIQAPAQPGEYLLRLTLVQQAVTPFPAFLNIIVIVTPSEPAKTDLPS